MQPEDEMKMVRQQIPRQQPHRQPFPGLLDQVQKGDEILGLMKDLRPLIAPIEHMVAKPAHRSSCRSCHAPILSRLPVFLMRKSRMPPFCLAISLLVSTSTGNQRRWPPVGSQLGRIGTPSLRKRRNIFSVFLFCTGKLFFDRTNLLVILFLSIFDKSST
jgi:hypothetical protein